MVLCCGVYYERKDVVGIRLGVRLWRVCWGLKCDLVSFGELRKFIGRGVILCDFWEGSWLGGGCRYWFLEVEGLVFVVV